MTEREMNSEMKPVIGLTGGIASGKSSVARILEQAGAAIVDADRVAREVVEIGSEGLSAVVAAFGAAVLAPDGSLDRDRLGNIVFGDEGLRARLQGILHPLIGRRSAQLMEEKRAGTAAYVIYDAPLLVEVGAYKNLAALIVVATPEATQIARAIDRDGVPRQLIERRLAAQLPLARKLEVADYVISNDGSLEELAQRTLEIHAQILLRFGLCNRNRPA